MLRFIRIYNTFLVTPGKIQTSMYGFAGIVLCATFAGIMMMRLQKKK